MVTNKANKHSNNAGGAASVDDGASRKVGSSILRLLFRFHFRSFLLFPIHHRLPIPYRIPVLYKDIAKKSSSKNTDMEGKG
jgi:hypothetical protein